MWQLTVEQQRFGTRLEVFGWLGSGMCYTGVCVADKVLFRTHASVSRRLLECVRMLRSCV
jgi:hypothetical protein